MWLTAGSLLSTEPVRGMAWREGCVTWGEVHGPDREEWVVRFDLRFPTMIYKVHLILQICKFNMTNDWINIFRQMNQTAGTPCCYPSFQMLPIWSQFCFCAFFQGFSANLRVLCLSRGFCLATSTFSSFLLCTAIGNWSSQWAQQLVVAKEI